MHYVYLLESNWDRNFLRCIPAVANAVADDLAVTDRMD